MDKNQLLAASDVGAQLPSNRNDYGTSHAAGLTTQDNGKDVVKFPSCRQVLYLMMFLGFVVAYSLRGCLNEAIVAMVNQTAVSEYALTANVSLCTRDPELENTNGEFNWDRDQQGTVLAAFYYGYILTQVGRITSFATVQ